jgi:hypothetical protein
MTPVLSGNYLFVAGFNNKNLLLELAADKPAAKTVWRDVPKKAMSPVNVQPFLIGNALYGFDQAGDFRCVELPSGEMAENSPPGVRIVGFDDFARGRQVRTVSRDMSPAQRDQAVERALSRVGERAYSLGGWNCEHFANTAHGRPGRSDQVRGGLALAALMGGMLLAAAR